MARVRDWGLVLLFAVRVRLLYAQHCLRTVERPSVCPIDRQQALALSSNGARRVARRRSTLSTCGQRHVGSRRRTTALEVRVRVGYERQVSAVVIFGVQVSGEQMSYIYGGQFGAVIVMLPRCALPVCLSVCYQRPAVLRFHLPLTCTHENVTDMPCTLELLLLLLVTCRHL